MTPHQFIAKWQPMALSERASYVTHFNDLCDMLGHPKPLEVDPNGSWFTFERGVHTSEGRKGWADVWLDQKFGWEYKGKHKDLRSAYQQLLKYREALNNPPLLIVCDLNKFEIHPNFPNYAPKVHSFDLEGLKDAKNVQLLRHAFTAPEKLRPDRTQAAVTQEIADTFAQLAIGLRSRDEKPERAAHFLMKLMFCMFAEDIELLPRGLFTDTVASAKNNTEKLTKRLKSLFEAMAHGGDFGNLEVSHFNGGLFADADVVDLSPLEINALHDAAKKDWAAVDPSIFGTLFERMLDPGKRSQLGAHYTSREDIETLLRPVFEAPLRREWEKVRQEAEAQREKMRERIGTLKTPMSPADRKAIKTTRTKFDAVLEKFAHRLTEVTVLDPACGSGNFLYVALHLLLNLEKEVRLYAANWDLTLPQAVRPTQLLGLEINEYAQQLAQEVIWIGFLQWIVTNGDVYSRQPILDPLDSIQRKDAILDLSDRENPKEPEWPAAEFIVGNPPFLGSHKFWDELGRDYQLQMYKVYANRIPGAADLCCYWFEKARKMIETHKTTRVGLLATQAIRGGANREVLARIKQSGDIFFAISDFDWLLDGAMVHASMIGYDDGKESTRVLDGQVVPIINENLATGANTTTAKQLPTNLGISLIGPKKAGSFNIPLAQALNWLHSPNPNGKPNSDVLVPWVNGTSLVSRLPEQWIIDADDLPLDEFCMYELPHKHAIEFVKPDRDHNKERRTRENWWKFKRTAPELRAHASKLKRYLATVRHAKHRIFAWVETNIVCDDGIFVFIDPSDRFFGVVHSRIHEVWAIAQGTQVRERESGFRYTPTTCFETFPFPDPTPAQEEAIAAAAKELDTLRNNWLNPPEWTKTEVLEFPGSVDGPWKRYVYDANDKGISTVRYPRIVPKDADAAIKLKKRTLTNLYNERPAWLANIHKRLDEAVFAAYGWPADLSDDALLAKLLALNLERASKQ